MRSHFVKSSSLGLCLGLQFSAWSVAATAPTEVLPPPEDLQLARGMLKTLVEIDTTHQFGSTVAAQAIQRWLLTAGYAPQDVTFVAPAEHPNKGNLVVRLHGKQAAGRAAAVLFLGHLDVVDAKREDWSVDPFVLTEQDGWYYGRGTIDMKDGDAALAEALIRLRREHFKPQRDLIVAFTADEEAGGDSNGPAFLLKDHRELIDADFVVNLDGGGGTRKDGTPAYFEVGTSEKTYATFSLEATSPGGHGSLPIPGNPIHRLAAGLDRLAAYQFPLVVTATTRASFQQFATLESGSRANDMRAVAQQPPDVAAAARLSGDVYFNAQLHTTCVATLISGGHAENALPQRARATVQCRLMPGDRIEDVQQEIATALADRDISLTLDAPPIVSPESPPSPQMLRKVASLAHSIWPAVMVVPTMATGFSDDRQMRNAGIPSYDISGVFMPAGENRAHGRDERINVQAFDVSVEFTYRLLKEMSKSK